MHDTNLLEDQPIAWTPTPDVIERAQLTRFMRQVGVSTWDELYEFSIRDVEKFTEEVLKFLDISFDPPYSRLLDTSNGIELPQWFISLDDAEASAAESRQAETRAVARVSSTDSIDSVPSERRPQESEPEAASANAERGMRNAESDLGTGGQESEPGAVATGSAVNESTTRGHAGLNITTMCLDRWQTDEMKDELALVWEGEEGKAVKLTYAELFLRVRIVASELRRRGFKRGDAIGIHLPMMVETVVALLAINRIGAIAVPVFSGYGVDAIASRLNAVGAKGLFTCDGFPRRGKAFDALGVAREAVARCPSIQMIPGYLDARVFTISRLSEPDVDIGGGFVLYSLIFDYLSDDQSAKPELTSAEDPLIILYTSGTTGKPKGIAHTHASFPIKAAQDMAFGTDVGRGTRICWYTDIGWMMGPWLIYGALINGATICIYDGAPDYPTHDRIWEFCARHKVEILGISPTLVRALAAHEESDKTVEIRDSQGEVFPQRRKDAKKAPHQRHDLSSLRAFASTGEPWNPAPWWWLFREVGNSKLPIINYSGGTEIAGGILMGNPLLPIKPCSFPAPCPGMDVDILDEHGQPVGPNQVGELVIKQPWIGMARGFWQERERYLETYWQRFPNIWVHGDWAMRDKDDHWFILGRSDDTLKVAGKRVGPAEVESLLVAHPLVTEAAVIGVPDEVKGSAMVAFCVLSDSPPSRRDAEQEEAESEAQARMKDASQPQQAETRAVARVPDNNLEIELKKLVAKDMGKPLAPSKIHFVKALPKTRNAKVMRRVIRAAYLGEDAGDLSALENPKAVEEIGSINR